MSIFVQVCAALSVSPGVFKKKGVDDAHVNSTHTYAITDQTMPQHTVLQANRLVRVSGRQRHGNPKCNGRNSPKEARCIDAFKKLRSTGRNPTTDQTRLSHPRCADGESRSNRDPPPVRVHDVDPVRQGHYAKLRTIHHHRIFYESSEKDGESERNMFVCYTLPRGTSTSRMREHRDHPIHEAPSLGRCDSSHAR